MAAQWRLAGSLKVLLAEVNQQWPHREKASDGTIGDASHASRNSDHNPWIRDSHNVGVVRALDVDSGPGLNPDERHDEIGDVVAEVARRAGLAGHPAMGTGSYVIHENQIASVSSRPAWSWRRYTGSDPHTSHPHISVTTREAGYDSTRPWGIAAYMDATKPVGKPPTLWMSGPKKPTWTRVLQRRLNKHGAHVKVNGRFGRTTRTAVRNFRRAHKIRPYRLGVAGPRVWRALGK